MKLLAAIVALFTFAGTGTAVVIAGADSATPALLPTLAADDAQVDTLLPSGYRNPRSSASAIRWALSQVGVHRDSGYCLRFVDLAFGRTSGPASAHLVWTQSPAHLHHTDTVPPAGALVVWSSAIGDGHGHIAVSLGDGRMVSTTGGPVSVLPIRGFADDAYLGWMPPYFYM